MKNKFIILILIAFSAVSQAQVSENLGDNNLAPPGVIASASSNYIFGGGSNVIYNNGPLITSTGTGVGGADESILQNITLGMTTLGAGHTSPFRVADDLIVTGGDWVIDSIDFFAYQTGATASTLSAVNLQIWDGVPGAPGSTVVFGDDTTNRMNSTAYTGILRVSESSTGTSNLRQISVANVTVGITLPPGTYWLDWQVDGDAGFSGPWAPPITIAGQSSTGNGMQYDGAIYNDLLDLNSATPLGLPFVVYGTLPPPPIIPTLSFYGLLVLMLLALMMGRQYIRKS